MVSVYSFSTKLMLDQVAPSTSSLQMGHGNTQVGTVGTLAFGFPGAASLSLEWTNMTFNHQ